MKTAISLPDDLFALADTAAKELRVSRSELYARAIAEFLDRTSPEKVTARLNRVYADKPEGIDPVLHRAQLRSIGNETW